MPPRGILTKRLRLRPFSGQDLAALPALLGDAEVMAFSDHGPLTREAQATWLDRAMLADTAPLGTFAAERRSDGRVVGYASLQRSPTRVDPGETEIGFRFVPDTWGTGIAREAVFGLLSAVDGEPLGKIIAIVDPHNLRSVRFLKALGLSKEREIMLPGYAYPDHVFALTPV